MNEVQYYCQIFILLSFDLSLDGYVSKCRYEDYIALPYTALRYVSGDSGSSVPLTTSCACSSDMSCFNDGARSEFYTTWKWQVSDLFPLSIEARFEESEWQVIPHDLQIAIHAND